MKSSISYKGLPEYPEFYGSLNYVYGLSDFWAYIFQDKELLDRTLETQSYLYAEIYSRFLQLTSTISLDDVQTTFHTSLKLALVEQPVDELGVEIEDLANPSLVSYTYRLPFKVLSSKYLLDRPILARKTYERDVHYNIIDDGDIIETFKPIGEMGFPVKRVSRNGKEYNQYAIWVTDAFLDEDVVYKYFGQFVNVGRSTSTDLYRDFIRGLYFLYSNGPTIELLGRGLNLAIGIPFARETEEVLEVVKDVESGNYNVVTASNSYTIPYGIPCDFEPGDILPENVPLANVAVIRDYRTDDEWWINVSIPRKILQGFPEDQATLATEGSAIEYYMREYLKYHTFLINVKVVASFTSDSMEEVVNLINQAKPTYTLPVFVWAVPLDEEFFVGHDEDFEFQPGLTLQEVMFYGEYIRRFNNIPKERSQTAWIRSNGSLNGYLGDTTDVKHVVKADPVLTTDVEIDDSDLIPLYNTDSIDLLNKLAILGYTLTLGDLPERFEVQNVDAVTHYNTVIKRETTVSTGVGYNNGDLDPFYGEIKRRFIPLLADMTAAETLVFMRIKSNLYSVFLKRATNTLFNPVYFIPAEDDPLAYSLTYVTPPCIYAMDGEFADFAGMPYISASDARLTLSSNEQKGTYLVRGDIIDGLTYQEAMTIIDGLGGLPIDFATAGGGDPVAFEFFFTTPTFNRTYVPVEPYDPMDGDPIIEIGVALVTPANTDLFSYKLQCGIDGDGLKAYISQGYIDSVTIVANSQGGAGPNRLGVWIDPTNNVARFFNWESSGYPFAWTDTTAIPLAWIKQLATDHQPTIDEVGQTVAVELVTSKVKGLGSYFPAGTKDICGEVISLPATFPLAATEEEILEDISGVGGQYIPDAGSVKQKLVPSDLDQTGTYTVVSERDIGTRVTAYMAPVGIETGPKFNVVQNTIWEIEFELPEIENPNGAALWSVLSAQMHFGNPYNPWSWLYFSVYYQVVKLESSPFQLIQMGISLNGETKYETYAAVGPTNKVRFGFMNDSGQLRAWKDGVELTLSGDITLTELILTPFMMVQENDGIDAANAGKEVKIKLLTQPPADLGGTGSGHYFPIWGKTISGSYL